MRLGSTCDSAGLFMCLQASVYANILRLRVGASYRHILSQSHTKKSENNREIIGGPQIIFRFRREVSRINPGGPARPALPNQMDRHTEPASRSPPIWFGARWQ